MAGLQQRFEPVRELRERAHQGGRVVGVVGHERNLTRTRVRLKGSRPEVTKSSHMVAVPVVWWCVPMSAPARPGARVRMRRPGVMGPRDGDGRSRRRLGLASPVDYRLTVRTQMALAAVGGRPGLNNREISEVIGLSDQGQVSRMLKRLSVQGLVENAQALAGRQVKAWRLTKDGEAVIDAHRSLKQAQRRVGKGGKLVSTRSAAGRRGKTQQIATTAPAANVGFRMTALTYEVLAAVAAFSEQGSNPTNREIASVAAVKDEGQISKLLARLERHGLLTNTGGYPASGNAWQLTGRGERVLSAGTPAGRELAGVGQ
jgi:DNA-binding MarR family transcriptional regulator